MKILLAGPGTGKTTNIKSIIENQDDPSKILVLSFTNATVEDLKTALAPVGIAESQCSTLHKFAVKYNHDRSRHVLDQAEIDILEQVAEQTEINFNDLCNFLSATTFDQMIERFVAYARANPVYLDEKLSDYSMVIVDEYQDFNKNEQDLIDLLVEVMADAYILGDDDQCIYSFKDASNDKIIALYLDKNHDKVEHEHKCYRCPDVVVDKATVLIKNNKKRVNKQWLKTGKKGDLFIKQFASNQQTAEYIASEINKILKVSDDEKILILSPMRFFAEQIVEQLAPLGVDYVNFFQGRTPFELIEKSWGLKLLFGKHQYLNLVFMAYQAVKPRSKLYDLIKRHYDKGQNLDELYALAVKKLPEAAKTKYEAIEYALKEDYFSDLATYYEKAEAESTAEKLEKLFVSLENGPTPRVSVMSIHKSKGLGAEHVFMIGLVEGVIPNRSRGNDTIESQRRLFYVGMTRAKKTLHLISSISLEGKYVNKVSKEDFKYHFLSKLWKGRASRFIEEIV